MKSLLTLSLLLVTATTNAALLRSFTDTITGEHISESNLHDIRSPSPNPNLPQSPEEDIITAATPEGALTILRGRQTQCPPNTRPNACRPGFCCPARANRCCRGSGTCCLPNTDRCCGGVCFSTARANCCKGRFTCPKGRQCCFTGCCQRGRRCFQSQSGGFFCARRGGSARAATEEVFGDDAGDIVDVSEAQIAEGSPGVEL